MDRTESSRLSFVGITMSEHPCEGGLAAFGPCEKTPTEKCKCCGRYLCGGHIHVFPLLTKFGKFDERPQKGAWAPGKYLCICCHCDDKFYGDKRAVVCADCSYGEKATPDAETQD